MARSGPSGTDSQNIRLIEEMYLPTFDTTKFKCKTSADLRRSCVIYLVVRIALKQ